MKGEEKKTSGKSLFLKGKVRHMCATSMCATVQATERCTDKGRRKTEGDV